jgi:hypothetical protein
VMSARSQIGRPRNQAARALAAPVPAGSADAKTRQSCKIRELGEALVAAGFHTLGRQSNALGLSRSTTWTVLRGDHKNSGLSATIINRMLCTPQLPPRVRATLVEYIKEKGAGSYGHSTIQRQRFAARLAAPRVRAVRRLLPAQPQ